MIRYTLVYLALNSGLRVSELAKLKLRDLQLEGKENYLIVQNGKGTRKPSIPIRNGPDNQFSSIYQDIMLIFFMFAANLKNC